MASKRPNTASEKTRYLRKIGHTWYVRVKVPRPLQQAYPGRTHVIFTLDTRDLNEAYRRKWDRVAAIKRSFVATAQRLARGEPLISPEAGDEATPADYRAALAEAREKGDESLEEIVQDLAIEHAEKLYPRAADFPKAKRWYDTATSATPPLDSLIDVWLAESEYREQTKRQHRQAYAELREFIGANALPEHVTDDTALDFVECIESSGKSYATRRRKVNSLGAFWKWMAKRKHVPRSVNPWRGHTLKRRDAASAGRGKKRAYRDQELVALLGGAPEFRGLRDVVVLGLYTGARLDELCSLRRADVRSIDGGAFFISIERSKTAAGVRSIAVVHPLPCAVLASRLLKNVPTIDESTI
jgi:hypothetical protein